MGALLNKKGEKHIKWNGSQFLWVSNLSFN